MKKFAVLGSPIAHSLSPAIYADFSKQIGLEIDYKRLEVNTENFSSQICELQSQSYFGVNITSPLKSLAYKIATEHSPAAQTSKVANVLTFKSGCILADNTDGQGLIQDLKSRHQFTPAHKDILILGAGSVVRGILPSLISEHPREIVLVNRTYETAEALAKEFLVTAAKSTILQTKQFNLIIDARAGSHDNLPPCIQALAICYQLGYQVKTPFLSWAEQVQSVKALTGIGMLVEQAALAFRGWFAAIVGTQEIYQRLNHQIYQTNT